MNTLLFTYFFGAVCTLHVQALHGGHHSSGRHDRPHVFEWGNHGQNNNHDKLSRRIVKIEGPHNPFIMSKRFVEISNEQNQNNPFIMSRRLVSDFGNSFGGFQIPHNPFIVSKRIVDDIWDDSFGRRPIWTDIVSKRDRAPQQLAGSGIGGKHDVFSKRVLPISDELKQRFPGIMSKRVLPISDELKQRFPGIMSK